MESKNAIDDAKSVRPGVKQWLCGLSARIRSAGSEHRPENGISGEQKADNSNVHLFPGGEQVPVTGADTNHSDRIYELELQNAVLIGDCAEWADRCQSLESNIHRVRDQAARAEHRLSLLGESVPETDTIPLSALQESYKNFKMDVTLKENKLRKARQRVAVLQEKRAYVIAEILALSPRPISGEDSNPAKPFSAYVPESIPENIQDLRDAA